MNHDEALLDAVRLTLISGIGPRIRRNLLDYFGNASEVFRADVFAIVA